MGDGTVACRRSAGPLPSPVQPIAVRSKLDLGRSGRIAEGLSQPLQQRAGYFYHVGARWGCRINGDRPELTSDQGQRVGERGAGLAVPRGLSRNLRRVNESLVRDQRDE